MLGLCLLLITVVSSYAQTPMITTYTKQEQELVNLSKDKWQWMADKKDIDAVMRVLTHHTYFACSVAWGHATVLPHLFCYGHEPRLSFFSRKISAITN